MPAELDDKLNYTADIWFGSLLQSGGKTIIELVYKGEHKNVEYPITNIKDGIVLLNKKISINFPHTIIATGTVDNGPDHIFGAGRINTYEDFLGLMSAQIDFSQFEITKEEFYKDVDIKLEDWPKVELP